MDWVGKTMDDLVRYVCLNLNKINRNVFCRFVVELL